MAASLGTTRANTILDALPTQYVALSSSLPGLDGSNITEPSASDYVRPSVTFAAASNRQRVSSSLADFISGGGNAATSTGNYAHFAIMTAATSGTIIWRGTLSTPIAWVAGQPVEIASGQITIGFDAT